MGARFHARRSFSISPCVQGAERTPVPPSRTVWHANASPLFSGGKRAGNAEPYSLIAHGWCGGASCSQRAPPRCAPREHDVGQRCHEAETPAEQPQVNPNQRGAACSQERRKVRVTRASRDRQLTHVAISQGLARCSALTGKLNAKRSQAGFVRASPKMSLDGVLNASGYASTLSNSRLHSSGFQGRPIAPKPRSRGVRTSFSRPAQTSPHSPVLGLA